MLEPMALNPGMPCCIDVISNVGCYNHITRVAVVCRRDAIQALREVFRAVNFAVSNKALSVNHRNAHLLESTPGTLPALLRKSFVGKRLMVHIVYVDRDLEDGW